MTTIETTLSKRGYKYGEYRERCKLVQELKDAMRFHDGWTRLTPDKKHALEFIMEKISRVLNGDPEYKDSWHDIAGYAKLVADSLPEDDKMLIVTPSDFQKETNESIDG